MGPLERTLYDVAILLLRGFEQIMESILSNKSFQNVPEDLTKNFPQSIFTYLRQFKAWKIPDEQKLLKRIHHALVALVQAQRALPEGEDPNSNLNVEFRTQIHRLRLKMKQIGGEDMLRATDNVCERVRQGLPIGDVCTTTITNDGNGGNGGGGSSGTCTVMFNRMTNEQLAHELMLDPKFMLSDDGLFSRDSSQNKEIRKVMMDAMWESMSDDLCLDPPCYVRVLHVLSEIREGIQELSHGRGNIQEVLDIDFLRESTLHGVFSWTESCDLITGVVKVIKLIQSPSRDDETNEKFKSIMFSMNSCVEQVPHSTTTHISPS